LGLVWIWFGFGLDLIWILFFLQNALALHVLARNIDKTCARVHGKSNWKLHVPARESMLPDPTRGVFNAFAMNTCAGFINIPRQDVECQGVL
jgi:hypothetical protein